MNGTAALTANLIDRCRDGAGKVVIRDRASTQRHLRANAAAGQLTTSGRDGNALNINTGNSFSPLNGLSDRLGRLFEIDDRTAADPALLNMANANGLERAVFTTDAIRLHNKAGHLGRTKIDSSHNRLTSGQGLKAFAGLPAVV